MFTPQKKRTRVRRAPGRLLRVVLLGWLAAGAIAHGSEARRSSLLLISIDGLRPDYVSAADQHELKIPVLRELYAQGVRAAGVRGVLPTATYPSHTSIITGAVPARHGIGANRPFGHEVEGLDVWYYYTEDIQVPTLWEAAAAAGLRVGNVSWPVSVGATAIHYNIPEYALTRTDEDVKITRGAATPGLMQELSRTAGEYLTDNHRAVERDWARSRYAVELIRRKKPDFVTVHLVATDHFQHRLGPFAPKVKEALEEIDQMVGEMVTAMREVDRNSVVCVVSDHGFSPVDRLCYLDAALVQAGLITLAKDGNSVKQAGIATWIARTSSAGGSAAVVLKNPTDPAERARVKGLLDSLAADPANGIARILDEADIAAAGGAPTVQFWVDMQPGFQIHPALNAKMMAPGIINSVASRGAHGYAPDHAEMNSTFILAGAGVRSGEDLGVIDMRAIAPTLARVMGVAFPSAELPALGVLASRAP